MTVEEQLVDIRASVKTLEKQLHELAFLVREHIESNRTITANLARNIENVRDEVEAVDDALTRCINPDGG